jgi:hypothetical protein
LSDPSFWKQLATDDAAAMRFREKGPGDKGHGSDSLPDWLKERFNKGKDFDRANRSRYPYNEVEVRVGEQTYRVDSLDPAKGEIVFRRLTQLADVQEQTALEYLNEFSRNYPVGAQITALSALSFVSGYQFH